jgi:signal transduction histidine kinase/streptogramin lyase
VLFGFAASAGSFAQPSSPEHGLRSYTLTAWTAQDGLPPGDVLAITEDLDGYLWVGTSGGLVRFDGAVFTPRDTRRETNAGGARGVAALVGSQDGSLWVGHAGNGGITRIGGSQVTEYSPGDGLFTGPVATLVEDRTGTIWAGGRGGLSAFRDGGWTRISRAGQYDGAEIYSIYEDRRGRLWLGTSIGVYAGTNESFELRFPGAAFVQDLAEDAHGTMWATDVRETVKRLYTGEPPELGPSVRVPQTGWRMASDDRGQLWIAALGGGLLRLGGGGATPYLLERFPYEHKSGGSPRSVFTDHDGNLWVGMRGGGLLRVSPSSIASQIPLEGLTNDGVRALVAGTDGSMWVATGHSLNRFTGSSREVLALAQTRALYTDRLGTLWAATAHGLGHVENGRFVSAELPSEVRWDGVMAAVSDANDAHWLCSAQQGLLVWRGGTLSRFEDVPEVANRPCSNLFADRLGRKWVGFAAGGVSVYANGAFQHYGERDGLAGDGVLAMLEDHSGGIWVTTRLGVSRFQNGQFATMTRTNGPFADLIAALVQDEEGYLWVGVNSGASVVRFLPREMDRVAADPLHSIEYALYDGSDGMQGFIGWQQSRALAARAPGGRVWLATGLGLAVVDPRNLPKNRRPVAPRIETVSADGRELSPLQQLELAPGISQLTINWGATSLAAASKLRFRYRLDGFDQAWVPAGTNRAASYGGLEPGRYRFRVSVTNDGVWTDSEAWEFSVAPPFYRSVWFLVLGVLTIAGATAGAWWLRLKSIRERYSLVLAERALVSREIHDTLLQSLAAIGVELDTVSRQLERSKSSAIESLRRVRHQARHSLREARDLAVALRQAGMSNAPDFIDTLRGIAEHMTTTRGSQVQVSVSGRPRRCSADVELQLVRISQEAMNNAIRHGEATVIAVAVEFRAGDIALRITDNGRGFDIHGTAPDDEEEHLGLIGMTERAERIEGRLTISSTPGVGTIVEAIAPFGRR